MQSKSVSNIAEHKKNQTSQSLIETTVKAVFKWQWWFLRKRWRWCWAEWCSKEFVQQIRYHRQFHCRPVGCCCISRQKCEHNVELYRTDHKTYQTHSKGRGEIWIEGYWRWTYPYIQISRWRPTRYISCYLHHWNSERTSNKQTKQTSQFSRNDEHYMSIVDRSISAIFL